MQLIITDGVAWSVCESLSVYNNCESAKMTELIQMSLGLRTWVGPSNYVLDKVQIPS